MSTFYDYAEEYRQIASSPSDNPFTVSPSKRKGNEYPFSHDEALSMWRFANTHLLSSHDLETPLTLYKRILRRCPPNLPKSPLYADIALHHAYLGSYHPAYEALVKAAEKDPSQPIYYFLAGICAYEMGQYREARECFETILRGHWVRRGQPESVDCREVGLDWTLSVEAVRWNERVCHWAEVSEKEGKRDLDHLLSRLPAGILFQPVRDVTDG